MIDDRFFDKEMRTIVGCLVSGAVFVLLTGWFTNWNTQEMATTGGWCFVYMIWGLSEKEQNSK